LFLLSETVMVKMLTNGRCNEIRSTGREALPLPGMGNGPIHY